MNNPPTRSVDGVKNPPGKEPAMNPDDFIYQPVTTPLGTLIATCSSGNAFLLSTYDPRHPAPGYPSREDSRGAAQSVSINGVNMTVSVNIVRSKNGDFVVSHSYGTRADGSYRHISDAATNRIEAKITTALPGILAQLTDALTQAAANTHRTQVKEAQQDVHDAEQALAAARARLAALTGTAHDDASAQTGRDTRPDLPILAG